MKETKEDVYLVKVHDGHTIYLHRVTARQKAIEQWLKWGRDWEGQDVTVTLQNI